MIYRENVKAQDGLKAVSSSRVAILVACVCGLVMVFTVCIAVLWKIPQTMPGETWLFLGAAWGVAFGEKALAKKFESQAEHPPK